MKRTLLLMLALLLPALAAADVSAQVNAPETYSTVWQSSTGRTIVTVDAAVEIPAVPQLMIYPAVQRTFTADDLQRAAVCFGGAPYSGMPSSLDSVTRSANSNPTSVGIRAESKNAAGNRALLTFVQHRRHDGNLWYGTIQFLGHGAARYQVDDLPTTGKVSADAREKAVQIAQSLDAEMALAYEGRCMGYEYDGGMSSLRGDLFIFTRKVNDAQTAWTSEDCQAYDNFEDTYQLKTPYEALRIIIDRYDGAIWMQWQAPHTIDLASGQAATLLPFDQIVTIAAQLLPLKYQFQEQYLAYRNQDANRMTVNRITLSYSRVQNRDNPENFSMLPVWDFFDTPRTLPNLCLQSPYARKSHVLVSDTGNLFCFSCTVSFSEGTTGFGIGLYGDEEKGTSYQYHFSVPEHRFVFEKSPSLPWPAINNNGLSRPIQLEAHKEYSIRLICDDTISVLYINGVALSARMYETLKRSLSLFAENGTLSVSNISLATHA